MIKKLVVSLVTASVLLSVNAVACGHGSSSMKPCGSYKKSSSPSTTSRVISAVSMTGLSAAQTKKIAEGIAAYESTTSKIAKMRIFPVDSFVGNEFDEKRFISEMSEKYIAAVAARATLFKYVFNVLDEEQRKIFKRAYAAPLISQIIRSY
ncbi:hypothetical protein JHD48_08915 [Sulfurimonas sp. SAG-AH-194-I05]|nr:hypothetical protein [Sulfurimonas sp. SAG-AH-194-I05]MDF1875854.1 hypothetical protein [Sulfurimonas sp. SAG-AH-194-I05]